MALTEYQKQRCIKVMDLIQSRQISRMFMQPVNPLTDSCPDYFTKIKKPMDLSTSRKKLESGQYENVEQWKEDIELIWNNALTYNGTKALISILARELQTLFRDLTCNISSDLNSDWNSQFEKLRAEFNQIVKSIPKPSSKQQKSVRPSSSTNSLINTTNQEYQYTNASKSASKTVPLHTEKNKDDNSPLAKPLTHEEIQELSRELSQIEDPEITNQIIDFVNRLEPQTDNRDDDEDYILEVEKLKDSTLIELRNMVSQLLGH